MSPGPDGGATRRSLRAAGWVSAGALGMLAAVAAVVAARASWLPTSDHAWIELRTRDVGSGLTPLVGPFSRLGWNHPGPWLFWLLAVPYRLGGGSSSALLVGAVALGAASGAACVVLAVRRAGWWFALLVMLTLAAMLHGLGPRYLMDPWNPYVVMLPMFLVVLAAWAVLDGGRWWLPVAVVVGAVVAGGHLGYLPAVAAAVVVATAAAVRRRWWRVVAAAALCAAIAVAPAVVQQVREEPGNLRAVMASARAEPGVGPGRAAAIVAEATAPAGPWLTGTEDLEPFTGEVRGGSLLWLAVAAAAGAGAAVVGRRAGLRSQTRLVALGAGLLIVGWVAAARTGAPSYGYLFQWLRPLAAGFWLAVVWTLTSAVGPHSPAWSRRVVGPVVAGLVVALVVAALAGPRALEAPDVPRSSALRAVAAPTIAAVDGRPVVVQAVGPCWNEVAGGLVLALEKSGSAVGVDPSAASVYGPARAARRGDATVRVWCAPGRDDAPPPGFTRVAAADVLSPSEWAESAGLRDRVRTALVATGRTDALGFVDDASVGLAVAALGDDSPLAAAERDRLYDLSRRQAQAVVVDLGPPPT